MSVVPGEVETDRQPPMALPLRHFVVGLGFLLAGGVVGLLDVLSLLPGAGTLAHVHLLLVGWVCLTIMGAMTQFVPVWSGVDLYSRRLAGAQLWLTAAGVLGLVAGLLWSPDGWLPAAALPLPVGILLFVYNTGRTLWAAGHPDVTEAHFAFALGCFAGVAPLGYLLALDVGQPVLPVAGVDRGAVVGAHATLAVFGAILGTVAGALAQLGTMFTQAEHRRIDAILQRAETATLPVGVVALALGRLLSVRPLARVGGLLVVGAGLAVGALLARRLIAARVDWTPILSRYAVAAIALGAWALLTAPAWLAHPLARDALLGAAGTGHLLLVCGVGFVVFGTLYHVVPFVVWVHRYADLLGYEPVPLLDDLYDHRLAALDFGATLGGAALLAGGGVLSPSATVRWAGGGLLVLGSGLFAANLLLVLRRHGRGALDGRLGR